jgi:hypothetical protein
MKTVCPHLTVVPIIPAAMEGLGLAQRSKGVGRGGGVVFKTEGED